MDCMANNQDMFDLKVEEQSPHYLFNSLLEEKQQEADALGGFLKEQEGPPRSSYCFQPDCQQIISELKQYICLRTTPLREIFSYVDAYYPLTNSQRQALIAPLRRHKNQLKRQHAKNKTFKVKVEASPDSNPVMTPEPHSPFEYSEAQPVLFLEEDSEETRKKKRNRMSAQISRDKRKRYIREIEEQNQQLRRKIGSLSAKHPNLNKNNKEFIKMVLCLGITCLVNTNSTKDQPKSSVEESSSAEAVQFEDANDPKEVQEIDLTDLERFKRLLPTDNQVVLDELMAYLDQHPAQRAESSGEFEKILEELPTQVNWRRQSSMVRQLEQQKKPT